MRGLSLFTGIGGLDLAAEWAGITPKAFCEIEPYAVSVLKKLWFDIPVLRDVREVKGEDHNDIDIVYGGSPCQDLSCAGKQEGLEGERSGLWFEMLRIIAECRPRFVLAENVRGAINLALDTVQAGMEAEGYEVRTLLLPAAAFGAPHQRERMFVIGIRKDVADSINDGLHHQKGNAPFQSGDRKDNGVSFGSDSGALWPTPHRNCSNGAGAHGDGGLNLQTAVSLWPTPTVGTSGSGKLCGGTGHLNMLRDALGYEEARKLSAGNGGKLNPEWVEILMGFPIGWTSIDDAVIGQWPGWPALMGEEQYPYEPPRTVEKCNDRAKRLKCLGNAVVPQQAYPLFRALAYMNEVYNNV